MSKVDWSLAPDDATHFGKGEDCGYWVKIDGDDQYFINISSWDNGEWKESPEPDDVSLLIERPRKQWSGPEDGLPPVEWCAVGKMVQVMSLPTHHHEDVSIYLSKPSKIVASYTDDDGDTFLMLRIDCDFGTGYECFAAHRVLPAKTEKQIAAEQRETAIREIMDIADVDCRVTAARLVDAGFKREVV